MLVATARAPIVILWNDIEFLPRFGPAASIPTIRSPTSIARRGTACWLPLEIGSRSGQQATPDTASVDSRHRLRVVASGCGHEVAFRTSGAKLRIHPIG